MFKGKVVWITGASSGIGAGLAQVLAKAGAELILSGRNEKALAAVAAACGGKPLILPFEVTDYAGLPAIVKKAIKWKGGIDCLINNAGISQRSLALETKFPVYQELIDIDLMAPIALTQLVLPHMAERQSGRLVFISSVAGKVGSPMRTAYSAAKHGLIGYADALRVEVTMHGIDVHVIAPGSIRTDVSRNAITSSGKRRGESDEAIEAGMDPDHAAQLMVRAMERGTREIILAKGMERQITQLRRLAPNRLFDMLAGGFGQYASRMKSGG
jgi:short-subunit dehydrogenase